MRCNGFPILVALATLASAVMPCSAAGFGTVAAIGGQAADIALDEARRVLYIANFTANRIDVLSTADNTVHTSINVSPQPGSLALSPDAQYLLIAHFGNTTPPAADRAQRAGPPLIGISQGEAGPRQSEEREGQHGVLEPLEGQHADLAI